MSNCPWDAGLGWEDQEKERKKWWWECITGLGENPSEKRIVVFTYQLRRRCCRSQSLPLGCRSNRQCPGENTLTVSLCTCVCSGGKAGPALS